MFIRVNMPWTYKIDRVLRNTFPLYINKRLTHKNMVRNNVLETHPDQKQSVMKPLRPSYTQMSCNVATYFFTAALH